jgi:hypothetical protein
MQSHDFISSMIWHGEIILVVNSATKIKRSMKRGSVLCSTWYYRNVFCWENVYVVLKIEAVYIHHPWTPMYSMRRREECTWYIRKHTVENIVRGNPARCICSHWKQIWKQIWKGKWCIKLTALTVIGLPFVFVCLRPPRHDKRIHLVPLRHNVQSRNHGRSLLWAMNASLLTALTRPITTTPHDSGFILLPSRG